MYTNARIRALVLLLATATALHAAGAQDPVRLPAVVTTAAPGPRTMVGIVRDTNAFPLGEAEVSIAKVARRVHTNPDGSFRFDSIKPGKYDVRARKVGYLPQIREIVIDSMGGSSAFALVPLARALPPVITSAQRGGLSGIVADTAFNVVPGADVLLMGHAMRAVTDSNGRFFIPAKPGSHMVSIKREGFAERFVSVTIPEDSGRNISVALNPFRAIPVREVWNSRDFTSRLSWRSPLKSGFYTHDDIVKMKFEWIADLVAYGVGATAAGMKTEPPDRDCAVLVNGGPATANLATLTVDEVEAVELYNGGIAASGGVPARPARKISGKKGVASTVIGIPLTNTDRMKSQNFARPCPTVYVWMR